MILFDLLPTLVMREAVLVLLDLNGVGQAANDWQMRVLTAKVLDIQVEPGCLEGWVCGFEGVNELLVLFLA